MNCQNPNCSQCGPLADEYRPPPTTSLYPIPKFIQRFEQRVDAFWMERWRQQGAERDHANHAKMTATMPWPVPPCRCSNCDPTGQHYLAWLADENRRKWAGR